MVATKEDILACFRLLLGREPHPEEIAGHFSRVGEPLAGVVADFLQSKECRRRFECFWYAYPGIGNLPALPPGAGELPVNRLYTHAELDKLPPDAVLAYYHGLWKRVADAGESFRIPPGEGRCEEFVEPYYPLCEYVKDLNTYLHNRRPTRHP